MEQIITTLVTVICGIIAAVGGFIITYLKRKTERLEKEKKEKQTHPKMAPLPKLEN